MIQNQNALLPGMAKYVRNQWYVIAYSREIGRELLQRDSLGDPVVLFRTEGGSPVALFDRCPHRGMPLFKGKLIGDSLQCGYHGIEFGTNGRSVKVPSGGSAPASLCVRSYPLLERAGWLWIWMGDPALADPAKLPNHEDIGLEGGGWYPDPGIHLGLKANYLLPLENLADATHITYLHHGLIDTGNVASMPYRLEITGTTVKVYRDFVNEPMPPMLAKVFHLRGERVTRTLELSTYVPNLVVIRNSFSEVDVPDPQRRINTLLVAVTPGGPTYTHEFSAFGNNYPQQHPNRFDDLKNLLMEDVVAIEEIQAMFDRLGPERCPELSVKADEPAIRVRRIIAEMLQQEHPVAIDSVV
jgi:phenylpropionate dioxygenase-like ring-hydroxylating dioxygenase large terminal subunit